MTIMKQPVSIVKKKSVGFDRLTKVHVLFLMTIVKHPVSIVKKKSVGFDRLTKVHVHSHIDLSNTLS